MSGLHIPFSFLFYFSPYFHRLTSSKVSNLIRLPYFAQAPALVFLLLLRTRWSPVLRHAQDLFLALFLPNPAAANDKFLPTFGNVLHPSLTTYFLFSLRLFGSLYQIVFLCKLCKYNCSSRLSPRLAFSSFCMLLKNFQSLHDVTQHLCAKEFHRFINNLDSLLSFKPGYLYTSLVLSLVFLTSQTQLV